MEYSDLLNLANSSDDPLERMQVTQLHCLFRLGCVRLLCFVVRGCFRRKWISEQLASSRQTVQSAPRGNVPAQARRLQVVTKLVMFLIRVVMCLNGRMLCEQVSHHPPVSAFHAESPDYTFFGSVHPKIKFCGKSIEIHPKGTLNLNLTR